MNSVVNSSASDQGFDETPREFFAQSPSRIRARVAALASTPRAQVALLVVLAGVLLGFGLVLPTCRFMPSLGDPLLDLIIAAFTSFMGRTEMSLWQLTVRLFEDGHVVLGLVLLLFSIVFPVTKLAVLYVLAAAPRAGFVRAATILHRINHLSMLDVFVVALLVAVYKDFPLGTKVVPQIGIYCFLGCVTLTMVASRIAEGHHYFQPQETTP